MFLLTGVLVLFENFEAKCTQSGAATQLWILKRMGTRQNGKTNSFQNMTKTIKFRLLSYFIV
jgi:hypothetical protein